MLFAPSLSTLLSLLLFLLLQKAQSANIAAFIPGKPSVSFLLDAKNSSLSTNLLSLGIFGYQINQTIAKKLLQGATGFYFRHKAHPPQWSRYDATWFSLPAPHFPSLRKSRNRVLLSSVRDRMGDGIGHMYYMYNFELYLALRLQLTFTHRNSDYQSLTKNDSFAVDNFFGWGLGSLPREAIWSECVLSYTYSMPTRTAPKCTTCESVTRKGPRNFKHLVNIPNYLVYNCTSKHGWNEQCDQLAHKLIAENNRSDTIFQIPPGACDYEGTNTNVTETGSWFYRKYWLLHGRRKGKAWPSELSKERKEVVRFDPVYLNVAVHIRRGDFFSQTKRRMLSDQVYASTVADVLDIIGSSGGLFSKTVPIVHIYSEGKLLESAYSLHDVEGMDNVYYDENKKPRSAKQWEDLVKKAEKSDERLENKFRKRVKVKLHISEDTLGNMHEMVAADIFIGSDSSMSLGPVYMLSRGVRLLATHPLRTADRLYAGFDPETGHIVNAEMFHKSWALYEAANGQSLLHFMQHSSE